MVGDVGVAREQGLDDHRRSCPTLQEVGGEGSGAGRRGLTFSGPMPKRRGAAPHQLGSCRKRREIAHRPRSEGKSQGLSLSTLGEEGLCAQADTGLHGLAERQCMRGPAAPLPLLAPDDG